MKFAAAGLLMVMTVAAAALFLPEAPSAQEDKGEPEPAPGTTDPNGSPLSETEQAIVSALRHTMDLLSSTFDSVVVYELPEILPNGDIIIRRKRAPDEQPASPPDDEAVQL
jgi:hypothetical protein